MSWLIRQMARCLSELWLHSALATGPTHHSGTFAIDLIDDEMSVE
jgi:hypothetical protein